MNVNDVAPPSPYASNTIGGAGNYNVNLFTGRVNYSATISDFKTSKLNLSVGVNFNSSGIKVQDVDGAVGIGWKLNAGGLITRYIRSLPDESTNGYCGANRIGGDNYGYYNSPNMTWINNVMNNNNTKTTWDSEPDQFYFSFLGFSGLFVLTPDGVPVLQSSYGLKVVYSPFNRTNGRMSGGAEDWIISDMAGNQYYFGDGAIEYSNVTLHGQANINTFTQSYISSWYLSKIVTADNQVINFQYQAFSQQSYTNYMNVELTHYNSDGSSNITTYNENVDVSIPTPLLLSKITTPTVELDFTYTQNLPNTPYLTEVDSYQNGQIEYKYQLNYTAVNYATFTRQQLSNIKQVSPVTGNTLTMYRFGYSALYPPERNSVQTDYWGYWNSNASTYNIYNYNGCDKTPDAVKTMACMLTSVTNMYGGVTNFTYEQNDYGNGSSTMLMGGLRIKTVSNAVNGVNTNTTQYAYKNPNSTVSSGQRYNTDGTYNSQILIFPNITDFSQSMTSMSNLSGVEVGYSWVTVTQADGSSIRRHFSNFSDYPETNHEYLFNNVNSSTQTDPYAPGGDIYVLNYPKTSKAFACGKELSVENFDSYGNNTSKTTYNYTLSAPINDVIWLKIYPFYPVVYGYLGVQPSQYSIQKADFSTQDLLLTSKTELANFFANGSLSGSTTTTEAYSYTTYANNNFLASKTRTLSNGNTEKITYRYPFNVLTSIPSTATTGLPMSYLTLNNFISQPVEIVKSVVNGSSGTETVLSVDLTRYTATSYGLVKPSTQYRLKTSGLLKSNYISYSVTPGSSYESETVDNTNLEQVTLFTQYDANGNLTESVNPYTANSQTARLWGYGKNYLIAEAKNAKSNEIYYDSFEESTATGVVSSSLAHTGTHYYLGNNLTIGWAVPDSKSYAISYWYISNGVWKYSGVQPYTGSSMTLTTGTGYDDICIYPSDALLQGYTYEPLVGLTSSEDSKGQTTSYQFDDFKRLINILDLNGNIVKNYNYYLAQ